MKPTLLKKIRVWDLPTRIFHWALTFCVAALFITAKLAGAAMVWHFWLGYCMLTLLLFRLLWGLVGGYWSLFSTFIYPPLTIWRFITGRHNSEHFVGHSPLGALSVLAMLAFLFLQVATGLVSDDEISNVGPFSRFVSSASVNLASWYHKELGQFILIGLLVLHGVAIAFYTLRKRQKIIPAMIHGDKETSAAAPQSHDGTRSRLLALALLLVCAALVFWLITLTT